MNHSTILSQSSHNCHQSLAESQIQLLGLNLGDKLNIFVVSSNNGEVTNPKGQLTILSNGYSFTDCDNNEFLDGYKYLSELALSGSRIRFEVDIKGRAIPYFWGAVPWVRSGDELKIAPNVAGMGGHRNV
jgi:hypothetical protein